MDPSFVEDTFVYALSLACRSNSLPPIYLKFTPNFVGNLI